MDRLRELIPDEALAMLEAELIRRGESGDTCRVALVLNLRRGEVQSAQVSGLRGVNALILT